MSRHDIMSYHVHHRTTSQANYQTLLKASARSQPPRTPHGQSPPNPTPPWHSHLQNSNPPVPPHRQPLSIPSLRSKGGGAIITRCGVQNVTKRDPKRQGGPGGENYPTNNSKWNAPFDIFRSLGSPRCHPVAQIPKV